MRLATWDKTTPNEYMGFSHYPHSGTSSHMWLNFRHEDIYTSHAEVVMNFGVYIWISEDRTVSFTTKMHDVHSADITQLQDMLKFLRKHNISTPFIKVEGRQHFTLLIKDILKQLKVTEQTNYPSDKITNVNIERLIDRMLAYAKSQFPSWDF